MHVGAFLDPSFQACFSSFRQSVDSSFRHLERRFAVTFKKEGDAGRLISSAGSKPESLPKRKIRLTKKRGAVERSGEMPG
jgi:hypothetical protein